MKIKHRIRKSGYGMSHLVKSCCIVTSLVIGASEEFFSSYDSNEKREVSVNCDELKNKAATLGTLLLLEKFSVPTWPKL